MKRREERNFTMSATETFQAKQRQQKDIDRMKRENKKWADCKSCEDCQLRMVETKGRRWDTNTYAIHSRSEIMQNTWAISICFVCVWSELYSIGFCRLWMSFKW